MRWRRPAEQASRCASARTAGKIQVTGAPEAVQRLLALLRAHRDELSALLRGDSCRHCGRWLDWSRPDAVTFADSTAAHLASRALVVRKLKRLEEVVSVSVVEPALTDQGWRLGADGITPEGTAYLHELYTSADPTYTGRATVPVLWDKERRNHRQQRIGRHRPDAEHRVCRPRRRRRRPVPRGPAAGDRPAQRGDLPAPQ